MQIINWSTLYCLLWQKKTTFSQKTFRLKHIFQPVYELSRNMYVLYYEIFFEIFCYLIYR